MFLFVMKEALKNFWVLLLNRDIALEALHFMWFLLTAVVNELDLIIVWLVGRVVFEDLLGVAAHLSTYPSANIRSHLLPILAIDSDRYTHAKTNAKLVTQVMFNWSGIRHISGWVWVCIIESHLTKFRYNSGIIKSNLKKICSTYAWITNKSQIRVGKSYLQHPAQKQAWGQMAKIKSLTINLGLLFHLNRMKFQTA